MGFQTFTCVICGESCTRRTSKRYGEGRACNKHDEVQTDQNNKLVEREKTALLEILKFFKQSGGKKHPVKDTVSNFLRAFIKTARETIKDSALCGKLLTVLKETKLIDLNYTVSDVFVEKFMELIKEHESDTDWDAAKKQNVKAAPVRKSHRIKKDDDDVVYRVKEHRGAKEAPRRKASSDKR